MRRAQKGDIVKVHYTGKLTNGEVFDSSQGRKPLEFKLGAGQVIPGFEAGILGMQVGEKKVFKVPKNEAYGDLLPQLITNLPKSDLPAGFPIQEGIKVLITLADGRQISGIVTAINEDSITIDANPPLAGKDLVFEVEVIEITESVEENSPLNRAIEENLPELVQSLIEGGMDPDGLDSVDEHPLTLAIEMDNLPIAQLLVSLGADVNLENWNRETPLMVAVMNSSLPFIEFLLEQGATPNVTNIEGYTPLLMAIWKGYNPLSIVRLLIEKGGADPNDTDYDGRSALMYAALRDDKALVEYLLQKGADKTLKDSSGKTAADYTESEEIKQLLLA